MRKIAALKAADMTMNRHLRHRVWDAQRANTSAAACNAPYKAKEVERSVAACSQASAISTDAEAGEQREMQSVVKAHRGISIYPNTA